MSYPILSLKPSYNSIIRGCPGIEETLPRIECELRIRSNDGRPFVIHKIEVQLVTIEELNSMGPSFKSIGKLERETVHNKKNIRIALRRLIGIDIPFTITLSDEVKETNFNKFGQSYTECRCIVKYFPDTFKNSKSDNAPLTKILSTFINVERYQLLASPKMFPPVNKKTLSPDRKFQVKYFIKNPCLTTQDVLSIEVELLPNLARIYGNSYSQKLFNKKLKLKSITVELKEYLEVYESHIDIRENILAKDTHTFNQIITESGITLSCDLKVDTRIPLINEFKRQTDDHSIYQLTHHDSDSSNVTPKVIILKSKTGKSKELQNHCSITTRGSLFSIIHGLQIKFKISNMKGFVINHPIDISAWPKQNVHLVEQSIKQEKRIAEDAANFYKSFGGIRMNRTTGKLEYPSLPSVVYTDDKQTMDDLDIHFKSEYKNAPRIPVIE